LRLSVWTPLREGWLIEVASRLAGSAEVVLVAEAEAWRAPADLRIYHVADQPAHGFVYRALLREPGLVILEDWDLHRLVHGETAGLGDPAAYRAEARRSYGPKGAFIAEQVLRDLGGLLPLLVPLNERVLEASLGLAATTDATFAQARTRLAGRPVVRLVPAAPDPGPAAAEILALARQLLPVLPQARRLLAERRAEEATPLGRALAELRPFARELGLADLPANVGPLLADLLPRG
jgi:hypothetical protein